MHSLPRRFIKAAVQSDPFKWLCYRVCALLAVRAVLPLLCFISEQLSPSARVANSSVSCCSLQHTPLQNIRNKGPRRGESSYTDYGFLIHELITHLSFGLNTQILLLSLGRALDRAAVFLTAKKRTE